MGWFLLLCSLGLWPERLPEWFDWLRGGIALGLLRPLWRARILPPTPGFLLSEAGSLRWHGAKQDWPLARQSRLLPGLALLCWYQGGRRHWYWCHQDSYDTAHWRRLCRLVLAAQSGDNIVGCGSDNVSG
ncbi:hypothetical protein GCM10023333_33170 [Ferrimonas pelagia]|uniref:Toxin CptA n=1 Tax=Ferrimonas pelagia TaxID=1177826 RepID=A0ABP9F9M2_9GAMM